MAIIACTQCSQQLQVPDSAIGQQVRCPKCNAVFLVEGARPSESAIAPPTSYAPPSPPRDFTDFDDDRRPSYEDEDRGRGYRDDYDRGRDYRRGYRDDYELREVPSYLAPAILCTLFCCLPFGIVAIVNASQVSTKVSARDFRGAQKASDQAKMWCWISFALGLAPVLIWIAIALMAARQPGGFR